MSIRTSNAIKLYGTDEHVQPMQTLRAGPVSCKFDQGAIRFIKVHGKEAIRNIAIVIRDKDWGTYPPRLSDVTIQQDANEFTVSYNAKCKDNQQEICYRATITGLPDGTITFTGKFSATTDFLTNRTGFVVLHPVNGVAGQPVKIESVTGDIEHAVFPELINPIQPFKNIRALTHQVLPTTSVCCRMTGDTFEMEDQRQWNDASYKTYVRPLALPWPFTIQQSTSLEQSVELTLLENNSNNNSNNSNNATEQTANLYSDHQPEKCIIKLSKSDHVKPMPRIGLGLEPQHLAGATACKALLAKLAPQQIVVWHELKKHSSEHLKQAAQLCNNGNIAIELQAVIPDDDFEAEIAELAAQCNAAKLHPSAVHVTPVIYLNSIMPGPTWPKVTDLATIYSEVRKHFPGIPIGGGMLSFFPELNRHRPPTEQLDFISHASNTITHACDDISVTENLEALPYIIKTCRSFADNKPYHVGPSSIGMRFNPYGSKTMENPNNVRIAMARMDPRQRGLVNAAWTTGYVSHLIRGGVDCINLHAPTGEFGIFNHHEFWQQPGFDGTGKEVYPVYHVLAGLTHAAGKPQLTTHSSMSREVEVFGYENNGKLVVWIANLTDTAQQVELTGLKTDFRHISTLSPETFESCTDSTKGFKPTTTGNRIIALHLDPYVVVELTEEARS